MGENLLKSSKVLPWRDVVTAWQSEVANYNYPTGSANGKTIGHYTQVIRFSVFKKSITVIGAITHACRFDRSLLAVGVNAR